MTEKRKITYEQAMALDRGARVWNTQQRQAAKARQEAREAAARDAADHQKMLDEHAHGWSNWEYDFDTMTETHACRFCGASETRKIRPL